MDAEAASLSLPEATILSPADYQAKFIVAESEKDVSIEAEIPHWVEADDVAVELRREGISVEVCGVISCRRTFWAPRQARPAFGLF